MSQTDKNPAAVALGRLGGLARSAKKTEAARENASKPRPGRRKKAKPEQPPSPPLP